MSEEQRLLQLHIEEDRIAFANMTRVIQSIDGKLDTVQIDLARLSTKFTMASSIVGFVGGLIGAAMIALIN